MSDEQMEGNELGNRVGKYELRGEIGQGRMGTVYVAYDHTLDREVAVKILAPHLVCETPFVESFRQQLQSAARLDHPNIVTVHDAGRKQGRCYFVMNYIEGKPLTDVIETRAPLPADETLGVLRPLAAALDYAHSQGMVHGDIKPANVIVGSEGRVTLTDFAIARAVEGTWLTQWGVVIGTPQYMSPEQAAGQEIDARSDQYALGVLGYEMLVGRVPFDAESNVQLVHQVVYDPVPPLLDVRPDLPVGVADALERVLAKDAAGRFGNCGEFVSAFEAALEPPAEKAVVVPIAAVQPPLPSAAVEEEETELVRAAKVAAAPAAATAAPSRISALTVPSLKDAEEAESKKRRVPVWARVLIGLAALIVVLGVGAYFAYLYGVLPPALEPYARMILPPVVVYEDAEGVQVPVGTIEPTSTPIPTPTPTPIPSPTMAAEAVVLPPDGEVGDTWTRPSDAMTMVFVPAGEFEMGSDDGDSDEQPVHPVALDGFWIDLNEVTNTQYRWCVESGECSPPVTCDWGTSSYEDRTAIDQPVVCVDWLGAQAYCEWADGRLPTEAEWEYAARGPAGATYPWGESDPTCTLAQYADCEDGTVVVGDRPDGASWCGALDMAGNVWEWVADWYGRGYYDVSPSENPTGQESGQDRVLRGGSWYFDERYMRGAGRYKLPPVHRIDYVGFRCVVVPE